MESLAVSSCFSPSNLRLSSSSFPIKTKYSSSYRFFTTSRSCIPSLKCSLVNDKERVKFDEFTKNGNNLVPLYRCIFSDQLTPVLADRCLVKEDDRDAPSFLFESIEQGFGSANVGRYSVIGAQPTMEIVAKENLVTIMDHEERSKTEVSVADPMDVPRRMIEGWKPQLINELPDAFCGGWVGYFSYDTMRYVEHKKCHFQVLPWMTETSQTSISAFMDDVIVFDHVEMKAHVIHWVRMDRYSSVEEAYNDGIK